MAIYNEFKAKREKSKDKTALALAAAPSEAAAKKAPKAKKSHKKDTPAAVAVPVGGSAAFLDWDVRSDDSVADAQE